MSHGVISAREVLTGARTYYVRKDGSDSNTGLVDDAAGAFLTIQKCIDTIAKLDMSVYQVTGMVGPGTYTEALAMKACVGALTPILQGDTSTPGNVILTYASGTAVVSTIGSTAMWSIKGFKVVATGTCSYGVMAHQGALVNLYEMEFGAGITAHITARQGGMVQLLANYSISGGAGCHILIVSAGIVQGSGRTVTISNTPAFSNDFIEVSGGGYAQLTTFTFSGSATGSRYHVYMNGTITTGNTTPNYTYFPGDAEGTITGTGVYDGASVGCDLVSQQAWPEVSVTGGGTLDATAFGKMHVCSGTSADYTLALPAVSASNYGKSIGFRMSGALTKLVTLDGDGSDTIDGTATRIMWANEVAIIRSTSSGWVKISGKSIPMVASLRMSTSQGISKNTETTVNFDTADVGAEGVTCPAAMIDTANKRLMTLRASVFEVHGQVQYNAGSGTGCQYIWLKINNDNRSFGCLVTHAIQASLSTSCVVYYETSVDVLLKAYYDSTTVSSNTIRGDDAMTARSSHLSIREICLW